MKENFVTKEQCKDKNEALQQTLSDLRANIRTSKESLSNRLDEVDKAIIGSREKPGGLLVDIKDAQKDIIKANQLISETCKNNAELKEAVIEQKYQIKTLKTQFYVALGIIIILIGGRFFGLELSNIIDFIHPPQKTVEYIIYPYDDPDIPEHVKKYVDDQISSYYDFYDIPEEDNKGNDDIKEE